jgi:hypothetical protein
VLCGKEKEARGIDRLRAAFFSPFHTCNNPDHTFESTKYCCWQPLLLQDGAALACTMLATAMISAAFAPPSSTDPPKRLAVGMPEISCTAIVVDSSSDSR